MKTISEITSKKLSELENLDAHGLSVKMRKTNSNITLRSSFLRRETKETSIYASIDLDGQGLSLIHI